MATYGPCHQSQRHQGLPPLTVEDLLHLSDLDYTSFGNQSRVSNTKSNNTSQDLILSEEFFTKGFVPSYNPPITDPLELLLIQVSLVPTISSTIPTSNILSATNGLWAFLDNFHPPSLP